MKNAKKHVALVCPGGPITRNLADKVVEIAADYCDQALQLHFHNQCFEIAGHFAGTDAARSEAFLEVANDPNYDAVWFARGGYGACRLDDAIFGNLNGSALQKQYLGYSDTGVLLARLYSEKIGQPVHGPMPTDLPRDGGDVAIKRALDFLAGQGEKSIERSIRSDTKHVAFNITVLSHMISAPWMPDFSDHVVMLEDVSEYLYCIDRSMFTIMSSPSMKSVAGIKLGRVSDVPKNDREFGQSDEEIIQYWCARSGIPYLGRADIGHDSDNKIVPFGP